MVNKEGWMKSIFKKGIVLFILLMIAFVQIGCKKEGTAEKTGKEIDKALDTAKDKINDATK